MENVEVVKIKLILSAGTETEWIDPPKPFHEMLEETTNPIKFPTKKENNNE